MNYLDELNAVQYEAVRATEGPVMIIAGPGSGKTRVLTYRIAYLVDEVGADPFNVLALTFTNKAAREMRARIENIAGTEARNISMGTFHSVFARILRVEAERLGYPSNFSIYDTQDSKNLVKLLVKEQNLNDKLYKPNVVFNRISAAKNNLLSPKEYQDNVNIVSEDESTGRPKIGKLYELYAKRCFQSGAMDFDDLLFQMYKLLNNFPDLLYKYQMKFKYILIDEYQDTNYAQYLVTKMLADMHQNICVVGDDAQSIYSFRGADIGNILSFEKDYPELKTFKLEQNYRSTQHIVSIANQIIKNNKGQLPKEIWTQNPEGSTIKVFKALSDNDEGKMVTEAIFDQQNRYQMRNKDVAILYRTNAQSRAFEEAMRRKGIAYRIYGGLSFYQRKEVKDLLAYLKLTVNHHDEEALRRVINYPTRGIGQTTLEKVSLIANDESKPLWGVLNNIGAYGFNNRVVTTVSNFVNMIRSFAIELDKQNAYDLAAHIAKSSGVLKELYNDKSVEGLSRYENLQELLNSINEFAEEDELAEGEEVAKDKSLGTYLQNVVLLTDQDTKDPNADEVTLMTIHAAKGLEFRSVFVVGLEENLFPSMMSLNSREDLEEERRLFYVAVTRAEKFLTITYAKTRYKFGNLQYCEPSRFVEEIDASYIEYVGQQPRERQQNPGFRQSKWQSNKQQGLYQKRETPKPPVSSTGRQMKKVESVNYTPSADFAPDDTSGLQPGMELEHPKFGFGKVLTVEGGADNRIATVFFNGVGQKRLMLKYAKVKIHNNNTIE